MASQHAGRVMNSESLVQQTNAVPFRRLIIAFALSLSLASAAEAACLTGPADCGPLATGLNLSDNVLSTTALQPDADGSALKNLQWAQVGRTPTTLTGYGVPTTGSGAAVQADGPTLLSPTLYAPNLGTPTIVNLLYATNLPIATGLSGAGYNILPALQRPLSGAPDSSFAGTISPVFTGTVTAASINATALDGAVIGGKNPTYATFTSLTAIGLFNATAINASGLLTLSGNGNVLNVLTGNVLVGGDITAQSYTVGAVPGVTCFGVPTPNHEVQHGIVTHC
jgi:hypothetical protein